MVIHGNNETSWIINMKQGGARLIDLTSLFHGEWGRVGAAQYFYISYNFFCDTSYIGYLSNRLLSYFSPL